MATRYSIWSAAEEVANEGGVWLVDGPWADAQHEDTIEEALEHLEICCEAMVDYNEDYDDYSWLALKQDPYLLDHLLEQLEPSDKWYDSIRELRFMTTLALGC